MVLKYNYCRHLYNLLTLKSQTDWIQCFCLVSKWGTFYYFHDHIFLCFFCFPTLSSIQLWLILWKWLVCLVIFFCCKEIRETQEFYSLVTQKAKVKKYIYNSPFSKTHMHLVPLALKTWNKCSTWANRCIVN